MKHLFACFVAVLVTWMSFAFAVRELRVGVLSMLETHIVMSSLISHLVLILMFRLTLLDVLFLSFPTRGSYTHFEPRHFDGPHFPHRGSCPTQSGGEVQRTVKTSSDRMVKCWISKIYLTNPSTELLTFSHPV
jgi:hypothetical protein